MKHQATISWSRNPLEAFIDGQYSRRHIWSFDGGAKLLASSSPEVVPVPMSDASALDPEEAFVASLASCHMLFFLSIAARRNYSIESYEDHPEGRMGKNEAEKIFVKAITLYPQVVFSGSNQPSQEEIKAMHQSAHTQCFLANSIKSSIHIIAQ